MLGSGIDRIQIFSGLTQIFPIEPGKLLEISNEGNNSGNKKMNEYEWDQLDHDRFLYQFELPVIRGLIRIFT